jgi:hypothetical protein
LGGMGGPLGAPHVRQWAMSRPALTNGRAQDSLNDSSVDGACLVQTRPHHRAIAEIVDLSRHALRGLVDGRHRVGGEDLLAAAGHAQAIAQVLGRLLLGEGLQLTANRDATIEVTDGVDLGDQVGRAGQEYGDEGPARWSGC